MDGHRWDVEGGHLMKSYLILRNLKIIKMAAMKSSDRKVGLWKLRITKQF